VVRILEHEAHVRRRGVGHELELLVRRRLDAVELAPHGHRLGVEHVSGGLESAGGLGVRLVRPDRPRLDPGLVVGRRHGPEPGLERLRVVVDDAVDDRPVGHRRHHGRGHAVVVMHGATGRREREFAREGAERGEQPVEHAAMMLDRAAHLPCEPLPARVVE
jgi:hypothetical protein